METRESTRNTEGKPIMIKTEQEIRDAFRRAGVSISKWAQIRGFSTNMVYDVLNGRHPRPIAGSATK
uniref:Phage-associated protein, BcepMu gp16 family n=1 Tax=Candidatus Kentrum sp. LPFa TaxID=2126335 RepID=A0A450X327_9GAMM|nr:MAG: phage-associated protein, BcepMu gp16 family [Candidatus Kentron sp. LPFa]VFK35591.1 MAG: phage-associated protein, BcepMu gp16 family [Candidatus Kentron sp. LPFa]